MNKWFFILLSYFLVFQTSLAHAESFLLDKNVVVARHETRVARRRFPVASKRSLNSLGVVFGEVVRTSNKKLESVSHEVLPICEKGHVSAEKIYHYTKGSDEIDVLYYDKANAQQRKLVKKYRGRAVAYRANLKINPTSGWPDPVQEFARAMRIECLPTRIHFGFVGKQRYLLLKSGVEAWQ